VQWLSAAWLLPYMVGLGVISYYGTFGGGQQLLKFGVDFLVIALFSIIIYFVAISSAKKIEHIP
jgi:hypothetical protein